MFAQTHLAEATVKPKSALTNFFAFGIELGIQRIQLLEKCVDVIMHIADNHSFIAIPFPQRAKPHGGDSPARTRLITNTAILNNYNMCIKSHKIKRK
jgi:hypothetical protein